MTDELHAVIDLGSNSVRLVIYQQGPHGTQQEIDNLKQTVRLSSHLDKSSRLTEEGILAAIRVIGQFKQLCDADGVDEIIGVATQAVRAAANRDELLWRIFEETGIRFRVVSGEEEARYGYLAVVNSIPISEGVTIDVGGGSTELTYFRDRRLLHYASIPYGAVSLTKEVVHTDPVTQKEQRTLQKVIQAELNKYPWLQDLHCPVIGMGGTARSVARVHQRRHQYPLTLLHGYQMEPTELSNILYLMRSLPVEKRSEVNGLSGDRADIIVGGMTILDEVLKRVNASEFVISNKGLRDGVLMEEVLQRLKSDLLPDILMYSIENIHDHFGMNREHAEHVWWLADKLLSELIRNDWVRPDDDLRTCLKVASLLHDIGRTISIYNARSHNFYLLLQVALAGINHRNRIKSAAIASFKTVKQTSALLRDYHEFVRDEDLAGIAEGGIILGLVRALDRTETRVVKNLNLMHNDTEWVLLVQTARPLNLELDLAQEWLKKWRKAFPHEIRLEVELIDESADV